MRLLDEMAENNMNLLSLMMNSLVLYDSDHDGYCWPVQHPRLECYKDSKAINSAKSTEFLRDIISEAQARGIEIQLQMNWGLWNPQKIQLSYPSATLQVNREGMITSYLHCPDCPDAWQLGLDEVADILSFYNHPNVKSYAIERLSYENYSMCFCCHTQDRYHQDTGASIFDASDTELLEWKQMNIARHLKEYIEHIKSINPNIELWLHSTGDPFWGHRTDTLIESGIVCTEPHTIQSKQSASKENIYSMIDTLAPIPCVLHFCVRNKAPENYPILEKTPKIIQEVMNWLMCYPGHNLEGILCFNEVVVSDENRKAVYEHMKMFP